MNDEADEPQKATSEEPEYRKLADEKLRSILEKHKTWIEAGCDETDPDRLRADLSRTHLRGQAAILTEAQLQGADLSRAQLQRALLNKTQLQGADLSRAQLQGAIFWEVQLQDAILKRTQLQGAYLSGAQLQGADLSGAQLQGADLSGAQLQDAYLFGAQLQGADLSRAQLQGAIVRNAQLRGAYLDEANFEKLAVTEDGEPGQDLPAAYVTDADFRDADVSNAQLKTVTGLRAEQLAGAVLTNAKLPDDVAKFDQLKHAEETARNATTVFFGLLAASLYSWLTIATTTDVAPITGTASSPLPIINTNIALSGFYLAAPLILIAVYFYFHLYLQRLWRTLASLPAVFPDGAALDDKAYPWLLNGLVRAHFKKLTIEGRPLTSVENVVSIFLAWWVVPVTLLAFWFRYLPIHDWWVTALHVAVVGVATGFGVNSYRLAVRTLSSEAPPAVPDNPPWKRALDVLRRYGKFRLARALDAICRYRPDCVSSTVVTLTMLLSLSVAIDPLDPNKRPVGMAAHLFSALGYRTHADLTEDDVSTKPSDWTGRKETENVEIAQVKGADLVGRDLRGAGASGAFLVKAKLVRADLRGTNFIGADLRGAVLRDADLRGAVLRDADLRGAVLSGADLRGADLLNANLFGARLILADLTDADLRSDDLRGANLRGANLTSADLSGADLRFADLTSLGLTQTQLDKACGDAQTQLPDGLTIRPCPEEAPQPSSEP